MFCYKRLFRSPVLLLLAVVMIGCTPREKSQLDLLNEYGSGVVMIVNQYYYRVSLDGGRSQTLFFTGIDSDGDLENLAFEEEEVAKNAQTITGTGFYISDDGLILTNRHVARPSLDRVQVKNATRNLMTSLSALCTLVKAELSDEFDELSAQKSDCYYYDFYGYSHVDEDALARINEQQDDLRTQYRQLTEYEDAFKNADLSDLKVDVVCQLGIAHTNTFVTQMSDFQSCVLDRVSDDDNVDLATIQLKSKRTDLRNHVFDLTGRTVRRKVWEKTPSNELTVGRNLYLLGYNAGFQLATSQGVQVQITNGTISQQPDADKILYSIPCLPGSSGSPVLDGYGRLVAVNFAGLRGTQSFNYGIPLRCVKRFLESQSR